MVRPRWSRAKKKGNTPVCCDLEEGREKTKNERKEKRERESSFFYFVVFSCVTVIIV